MFSKHSKFKETLTKTYYNEIVKPKGKKRLLKAERERELVIYEGFSIILRADFSSKTMGSESSQMTNLTFLKKKKLSTKNHNSNSTIFQE